MKDTDVIKALECCKMPVGSGACNSCLLKTVRDSLRKEDTKSCTTILLENTLDLINRQNDKIKNLETQIRLYDAEVLRLDKQDRKQKAEIEELKSEIDKQYEQARADIIGNMSDGGTSCHWCIEHHRNQAIKEFAERLKKEGFDGTECVIHEDVVFISNIDNLVKEMTEGSEGSAAGGR